MICFKAFMLTNKSNLTIHNFFEEHIDLKFQACGYAYTGLHASEPRVINSIYYDGHSMYATNVYYNSNGKAEIGVDSFKIQSEDSLIERKIF